jgi:hypothetical protein
MRYKIVAAILLILSFNFVLAAPVQVVPTPPADAVWGGGDTMVMPGNQVQEGQGSYTSIDQWLKKQPKSWPLGPEPDQLLGQPHPNYPIPAQEPQPNYPSKTQDPLGLTFLRICQRLNRRCAVRRA